MPTNYDELAEDYKRSKQVAWRYYIEQYSLCELAGEVSGLSVLDLACGDGHYTRIFKKMGASRVVGVDISTKMIELATVADKREPLGIEYLVGDARSVHFTASFDVVPVELRALGAGSTLHGEGNSPEPEARRPVRYRKQQSQPAPA
jgi:ubiquinone/menaquinone biosynthesis C-methylase UbiE